jgi:hypothetical protein
MVKRLSCVLGKIRSKTHAILIDWFSKLKSEFFLSIVSLFKNYVVKQGAPTLKPEESFVGAIKSLSLLSSANEVPRFPILPISVFYIYDFGALNFKEEFRKWKRSLESPFITEFALFNYPFLFDPVAKTRIMHIDAMVKMSLEYEDACVNQALVHHAQRFLDNPSGALKGIEEDLKESINPYFVLEVRRAHLVDDVLRQVRLLP